MVELYVIGIKDSKKRKREGEEEEESGKQTVIRKSLRALRNYPRSLLKEN